MVLSFLTLYQSTPRLLCDREDQDSHPGFVAQLQAPLTLESSLPEAKTGVAQSRSITAVLDNIPREATTPTGSYLYTLEELLGIRADAELYDEEQGVTISRLTGVVTEVDLTPESASLTIESLDADALETPLPPLLIPDLFPSADLSTVRDPSPSIRVPFGLARKVDLGLCHATFLQTTMTITSGGTADRYIYCDDTSCPDYVVQDGDRLVYDVGQMGDTRGGYIVGNGTLFLNQTTAVDQNGLSANPAVSLAAQANGKWYRRDIVLPAAFVGTTLTQYLAGCENDTPGTYTTIFANVAILDRYGNVRVSIYNENVTVSYNTTTPYSEQPTTNTAAISVSASWDLGAIRLPVLPNYALQFSATGAIIINNPGQMLLKTFTAGLWVNCGTPATFMHLFGRQYSNNDGWVMTIDNTGKLAANVLTGGGVGHTLTSTATVGNSAWHSVYLTVDDTAKRMTIYVDGAASGTTTYTGTLTASGGTFTLANALYGNLAFTGTLAGPQLFGRVLSAGEIARHHTAMLTGYEQNLAGYWPLEDNTLTTVADASPAGNDGVVTNGTWTTGPGLIANCLNEVYLGGAVLPREQWQLATWGGCLLARLTAAPRTPDGRLPTFQADLVSREFAFNPALIAKFLWNDPTWGLGKAVNAGAFGHAQARYAGLLYPDGYQMDGCLKVQQPARDLFPRLTKHGGYFYKDELNQTGMSVDVPNYSFAFDGSNDLLSLGDVFDRPNVNAYTVEFQLWLRATTGAPRIFSKETSDASGVQGFVCWIETDGTLRFRRQRDGVTHTVTSLAAVPLNEWHHWAIVYDGATLFLYRDLVLQQSLASTLLQKNTTVALTLGATPTATNFANMILDEFRCWTDVRTTTELQTYAYRELTETGNSLSIYLTFNEYQSGAVFDHTTASTWYLPTGGATHATASVPWDDPRDDRGSILQLGDGDLATQWNNCQMTRHRLLPTSERVAKVTMRGDEDPGFNGQASWLGNVSRSVSNYTGATLAVEEPFLARLAVLERECQYLLNLLYYGREQIEVNAHKSARLLREGQRPLLNSPNLKLANRRFLIESTSISATEMQLRLRGWDLALYTFANGSVNGSTQLGSLTDYTQTLPSAPSTPTLTPEGYFQSGTRSYTARTRVTSTAPGTPNITHLIFKVYRSTDTTRPLQQITLSTSFGQTKSVVFETGTGDSLIFAASAFASANKPGFQEGPEALSVTYATPATPGAYGTPTGVTLSQGTGKSLQGKWTEVPQTDALYNIYLSSNGAAGPFTLTETRHKGVTWTWTASTLAYGTNYAITVSSVNPAGQESAQSIASGVVYLVQVNLNTGGDVSGKLPNPNLGGYPWSDADINNLNAQKITTGTLTVNGGSGVAIKVTSDSAMTINYDNFSKIRWNSASGQTLCAIGAGSALPGMQLEPIENGSIDLRLGTSGIQWSHIYAYAYRDINLYTAIGDVIFSPGSGQTVYVNGNFGASGLVLSGAPSITAPNMRVPLYDTAGALKGYLWASATW